MSSTANISWNNQSPSNTQELYYGRDALVTGFPGTGTGWIASTQNPIPGNVGSLSITNLDDNVKYKFIIKSDCTNSYNMFSSSTAIKWICGNLQLQAPSGSSVGYTLSVDPSTGNPGSSIGNIVVTLVGVDRVNQGVIVKSKTYAAPFSSTYSDQFNNVIGSVDWTIKVSYQTSNFPAIRLYECSSQIFSTNLTAGSTLVHVRNAMKQGLVSQLTIGGTSELANPLDAGYGDQADITTLVAGGTLLQVACTLTGVIAGTQLQARLIRAGTVVTGGAFTYIGANSNISSVPWAIQNGDVIQISDANEIVYFYKQPIVTKTTIPSNGYNVSLSMDIARGADTPLIVTVKDYDYGSSATDLYTTATGNITVLQGQTKSNTFFIASTLTADQFTRAVVSNVSISTGVSGVNIPYYYQ